jgi:glycosyltransferase involved in cell wall biosynthesis
MLTGNPIVSPNFPATQDILNENNCTFTPPENSEALAATLRDIINSPEASKQRAIQAAKDVREITFKKVTGRLLKQFPS